MLRTTKLKTITAGGTPQPMFGSKLSAAIAASPTSSLSIPVLDSSDFRQGDWALLVETNNTLAERCRVQKIPDATHIVVDSTQFAHASGAWAILSVQAASVYVQTNQANGAPVYIGNSYAMVKATFAFVVAVLVAMSAGIQPIDWTSAQTGAINGGDTAEYWVDGTTADGFIPSFTTI